MSKQAGILNSPSSDDSVTFMYLLLDVRISLLSRSKLWLDSSCSCLMAMNVLCGCTRSAIYSTKTCSNISVCWVLKSLNWSLSLYLCNQRGSMVLRLAEALKPGIKARPLFATLLYCVHLCVTISELKIWHWRYSPQCRAKANQHLHLYSSFLVSKVRQILGVDKVVCGETSWLDYQVVG